MDGEGGGKVVVQVQKIQETRQSSHTPKDINPLPTDCDTRCIHTHVAQWNVTWTHTRPKIQRDKEMDVSF